MKYRIKSTHEILKLYPLNQLYSDTSDKSLEALKELEILCNNADGTDEKQSASGLNSLEDIGIRADALFLLSAKKHCLLIILLIALVPLFLWTNATVPVKVVMLTALLVLVTICEYFNLTNYKNYIKFRRSECNLETELLKQEITDKHSSFPNVTELNIDEMENTLKNNETNIKKQNPDIFFKISALINNLKDVRLLKHYSVFLQISSISSELIYFLMCLSHIPNSNSMTYSGENIPDYLMNLITSDFNDFITAMIICLYCAFIFVLQLRNYNAPSKISIYLNQTIEMRKLAVLIIKERKV